MPYTAKERIRIRLRAKGKVGLVKKDAEDRFMFIDQCMTDMMDSGESDNEDDARSICELLWQEESDLFD